MQRVVSESAIINCAQQQQKLVPTSRISKLSMITIIFLHEFLNIEATVSLQASVVDPNTLNLDPDPGFWPNLDPDPGLYNQF